MTKFLSRFNKQQDSYFIVSNERRRTSRLIRGIFVDPFLMNFTNNLDEFVFRIVTCFRRTTNCIPMRNCCATEIIRFHREELQKFHTSHIRKKTNILDYFLENAISRELDAQLNTELLIKEIQRQLERLLRERF